MLIWVIIIFLGLSSIVSYVGDSNITEGNNTVEEINNSVASNTDNDVLSYLESKYNEKFYLKGEDWGNKGKWYIYTDNFMNDTLENEKFTINDEPSLYHYANCWYDKGTDSYRDNYYAYLIKPEINVYFDDLFDSQFGESEVLFRLEDNYGWSDATSDTTLMDVLNSDNVEYCEFIGEVFLKYDSISSYEDYRDKAKEVIKNFSSNYNVKFLDYQVYVVNEDIYNFVISNKDSSKIHKYMSEVNLGTGELEDNVTIVYDFDVSKYLNDIIEIARYTYDGVIYE